LLSSERRLIRAFRGRFCFDFGVAARCFETSITLTEGETHRLGASLKVGSTSLSLETSYTMERSITYGIGNCDSIAPVLCYDDATVEVFERSAKLLYRDLHANEIVFTPSRGRPFIAGNKILDDPECGCAAGPPTGGDDDRISVELDRFLTRLFATRELTSGSIDDALDDPAEVPSQALSTLESWVTPTQPDLPEAVGLIDIRGSVKWFSGPLRSSGLPEALLVSHDCNAALRGYLAIPEMEERYPVLLFSTSRYAETAVITLHVQQEEHPVEFLREEMSLRANQMTAAFALVDFHELPQGTSGDIHIQLFNGEGDPVSEPVVEPFRVVTQPVGAGAVAA
jgi:hypothetical protein